MIETIEQMAPNYGAEEIKAVTDYLHSGGWLTEFRKTRELEAMIADYVDTKHCIMTPNATLALYAMLTALNIGPGDEVIVPAFTMVATANAVRMTGADVVFVDIDRNTLCLDLGLLEQVIGTGMIKAVLLVDLNGRSPDMDSLLALTESKGVLLLEDAAQALGSSWHRPGTHTHGQALGTFGKAGVFSFSVPKVITTGQGGCIVMDDNRLAKKLRSFKDFGRPHGGCDEYLDFGINLKFTDLQAVIGIEQMKKLPERTIRKKAMYQLYESLLGDISQVKFLPTNLIDTSPWFIDVLVEHRDELQAHLLEQGIKTRQFYPALPTCPACRAWRRYTPVVCPVTQDIAQRGLWLPSSSFLTNADIGRVCNTMREFYEINAD